MNKSLSTGKNYENPEKLSANVAENVRNLKVEQEGLRAELTKQVEFEMPRSSKNVIDAIVTRRIYEKGLKDHIPDDPELTLKPDMKRTIKQKVVKERYHNGKYEKSKFDPDGGFAWSCCQSSDEQGQGCVIRKIDK